MKFWDSSAIVPLLVSETLSPQVRKWREEDPAFLIWALTPVEIWSSIYRKVREGNVKREDLQLITERLSLLAGEWSEIVQLEAVRKRAIRLLAVHPLASADAMQLAAALLAFDENPEGEHFVTFDARLGLAAQKEGFTLLTA